MNLLMPTKADFRGLCVGVVAILSRRMDATVFEWTVRSTSIDVLEETLRTADGRRRRGYHHLHGREGRFHIRVVRSFGLAAARNGRRHRLDDWDDLLQRAPPEVAHVAVRGESWTSLVDASTWTGSTEAISVSCQPFNETQPPVCGRPFWSMPPHPLRCGSFDLRPVWPSRPLKAWRLDRTALWQWTRPP